MENAMTNSKPKVPMMRTLNENVPPLQIELDDKRGRYFQSATMSPRFQPHIETIDGGSPLARYFYAGSPVSGNSSEALTPPIFASSKYSSTKAQEYCGTGSVNSSFGSRGRLSLSPLSSIENFEMVPLMSPSMYGTPVKLEEEVLVMDDIQVRSMSGEKSGRSSTSSSRRGSSSSSSSKSAFKMDLYREWEESGSCRYNSKCQVQTSKSSVRPGPCIYSPNSLIVHEPYAAADSEPAVTTSQPASPGSYHTLANSNTINDWSPFDDGIEVSHPNGSGKSLSREEFDAYIFRDLTPKRRLPVFVAFCEGKYSP